jgi:hypothetical protein
VRDPPKGTRATVSAQVSPGADEADDAIRRLPAWDEVGVRLRLVGDSPRR